jgi:alpha-L-rhamnosidase
MLLAFLVLAVSSKGQTNSVTLINLLCEHLPAPLSIPTLAPRFSWQLAAATGLRNVTQTAYQVVVASTPSVLLSNTGDIWDSGVVTSNQSILVPYNGSALQAGQLYYWKARAWTSNSPSPTSYSAPASFGVGLQSRADWNPAAVFIGMASANNSAAPWFRTEFNVSTALLAAVSAGNASALLHVASIGYHIAYVNGNELENTSVLLPSVANLGAKVPAHTYDVSEYITSGTNVLGLWLGPGWSMFAGVDPVMTFNITKAPLVMAELRIQAAAVAGGTTVPNVSAVTSSGWKCSQSTTSHLGEWTNSNFGGDQVNYFADIPGWNTLSVNASSWEAATVYPWSREVSPENLEPTSVIGTVPAQSVVPCSGSDAAPGCYLITMAELYTGWLRFSSLDAVPGVTVTISYSTNAGTTVEYNMMDHVTISAPGQGFCGRFSYHEIQYVTITNLSSAPSLSNILGLRLMSNRPRSGSFQCSNSLLTAIYNATIRTYEGLTTGGMTVDCPHRERLGYGGDGHTSMELAMATFASSSFFTKVATDWSDVQGWDGTSDLPHTAPTIDGGGGPGWGGFIITMPWHLYVVTGDIGVLESSFPHATRFLDFLLTQVNATGVMSPFGGYWGFLGDWLTPHGSENSGTPESVLFNNCYLVYCLRITSNVARLLGQSAIAEKYETAALSISTATHAVFYINATSSYLDTRQTHQVMPLIAGVVPEPLIAAVMTSLVSEIKVEQSGHLDTGLHGTYFLAKLLTDPAVNRNDLLFLMANQTSAPSYGEMLANGYTTWPEEWGGSSSRMHGCLNGFGLWFNQGILGVRADPAFPGFQSFFVSPAYGVGDITSASGSTLTPYGTVETAWTVTNSGSNITQTVVIPPNTAALLTLPAGNPNDVMESGQPAMQAQGVAFISQDGNNTVWLVTSGAYDFTSWI